MSKIKQPKIRFKGHINDWEQRKLKNVSTFKQGIQVDLERQYKIQNNHLIRFIRIVDYTQNTQDIRYIDINTSKNIIQPDDIIMVRYGATAGFIGRGIEGILANNMFSINPTQKIVKDYLYIYLKQDKIYKQLNNSNGSSAMPAINFSLVGNLNITYPNFEEQEKIGTFFKTLDDTIALHQQKLEVTKQFKQTMLKKMFPKNGETTPEIRFKGFTGDWKEEKLGNLIKLNKSQEVKRENLTNIRNGYYVLGMRTFSKDGYLDKSKDFWYNLPVEDNPDLFLNIGEFAMIDADMDSELSKIGKVLMNASDEKYLLNSHICKVSLKNENNYNYLFSVMSTPYTNKLLKKEANGSIAKGILNKDVYKQKVLVTEDKKEQELIGDFFYQLEKEIYLIGQKLETYKSFKKAMLQKMFI